MFQTAFALLLHPMEKRHSSRKVKQSFADKHYCIGLSLMIRIDTVVYGCSWLFMVVYVPNIEHISVESPCPPPKKKLNAAEDVFTYSSWAAAAASSRAGSGAEDRKKSTDPPKETIL